MTIEAEIELPEWGRWALLFNQEDWTDELEASVVDILGEQGERWRKVTILLRVRGMVRQIPVGAFLVENDNDAVALRLVAPELIIKVQSLTC